MIRQHVVDAIARYQSGLEAGVVLLRRLEVVAGRQRDQTAARDYEQLSDDGDAREQLTRALVALEPGLREVRAVLLAVDERVLLDCRDYREVIELRESARALVGRILALDKVSMRSLSDVDLAHRAAMASLETGEHTLAAYRRVLAPAVAHASLLDRRL